MDGWNGMDDTNDAENLLFMTSRPVGIIKYRNG
jgi:hypothetical protein